MTPQLVDELLAFRPFRERPRDPRAARAAGGRRGAGRLRPLRQRHLRPPRRGAGQAARGRQDAALRPQHPHAAWPVAAGTVRPHRPRRARRLPVGPQLAQGGRARGRGRPLLALGATIPSSTAALWWEWHVRLGREAGAALGPERYLEVRYESLVEDPAGGCRALCAFLDLPYDERMLALPRGPHARRARARREAGVAAGHARPARLAQRAAGRTSSSASRPHRESCWSELGYARGVPSPGDDAVDRAALARRSFAADIGRKPPPPPARRLASGASSACQRAHDAGQLLADAP